HEECAACRKRPGDRHDSARRLSLRYLLAASGNPAAVEPSEQTARATMKTKIMATGVLALGLGGSAFAQEGIDDTGGVTVLERIVVTTPLRRESSLERSPSSVTVIGEDEIARSAASDLPSLLRSYPGVSVSISGGLGARAGLSLRGAKSTHTLVLING